MILDSTKTDLNHLLDWRHRCHGTVVFTNGCFDVLHIGHVRLLNECRHLAGDDGMLVVGLNSDLSIRQLKGPDRPVNRQDFRSEMLVNLKADPIVIMFDELTPRGLVDALDPDVVVKGSEYPSDMIIKNRNARVHRVEMVPGLSTSKIICALRIEDA